MAAQPSRESPVRALERLATAAVAVTGRILAEVAPDLTFLQWRALVVIGESDGVAVSEIARQIGSKLPATSRLVGRLRDRGLVGSGRETGDARVTIVRLTPAGATLRRRVIEQRRRRLRSGAERVGLGEGEAATLARVVAAVEGADPMPPPGTPVDRPVGTGRLGQRV